MDLNQYKPEENSFNQKYIVVTGATDGIGRALSIACAQLGAQLLLISKNEKKLETLIEEISTSSHENHNYYTIDFSTAGETDYIKFAEHLDEQNKPIDSLILNAGYIEALQGMRNFPLENWLRTITVNQHSPFMLAKCCIPFLEKSIDPSIIFSTHECNKAYWGAYGVAKSAQLSMMKILADELDSDKPIRVNGVDPSPVRTKLRLTNFPGINPDDFASPEEIIAPYLFFVGAHSKGITGTNHKRITDYVG